MEFMLLFLHRTGASSGPPGLPGEMQAYATELTRAGKLARGVTIDVNADVARVRVRDGKVLRNDGASADTAIIGGFWIIDATSRAEAIEIARRCPHARHGIVEVHLMLARHTCADSGTGTPFLYTFHMEPGLTDIAPKMREMRGFGEMLERSGKLFETAPLSVDVPPARIEARGGTMLVTDGPFAESKEAVGGYGLSRIPTRAEAIDIAERYPHAKWGPVEVREALWFDPT